MDITIVIITHERPIYLERALNYAQIQPFKYVILDSSLEPYSKEIPPNADYFHYPRIRMIDKLNLGIIKVNTKFVAVCADDDFLLTPALISLKQFLIDNESYSSVSGKSLSFNKHNNILQFYSMYSYASAIDISGNDFKDRLFDSFVPYFPLFYGVHRTKNLVEAFSVSKLFLRENYNLTELAVNFCVATNGKWRILPQLYHIREQISGSDGSTTDGLAALYRKDQELFNSFICELSKYLEKKYLFCYSEAESLTLEVFKKYTSWEISKIFRIKRKLSIYFSKFYKSYQSLKRTRFEDFSQEDRIQLQQVSQIINNSSIIYYT
jgi:glycosyltransferase domain-containing protein